MGAVSNAPARVEIEPGAAPPLAAHHPCKVWVRRINALRCTRVFGSAAPLPRPGGAIRTLFAALWHSGVAEVPRFTAAVTEKEQNAREPQKKAGVGTAKVISLADQ